MTAPRRPADDTGGAFASKPGRRIGKGNFFAPLGVEDWGENEDVQESSSENQEYSLRQRNSYDKLAVSLPEGDPGTDNPAKDVRILGSGNPRHSGNKESPDKSTGDGEEMDMWGTHPPDSRRPSRRWGKIAFTLDDPPFRHPVPSMLAIEYPTHSPEPKDSTATRTTSSSIVYEESEPSTDVARLPGTREHVSARGETPPGTLGLVGPATLGPEPESKALHTYENARTNPQQHRRQHQYEMPGVFESSSDASGSESDPMDLFAQEQHLLREPPPSALGAERIEKTQSSRSLPVRPGGYTQREPSDGIPSARVELPTTSTLGQQSIAVARRVLEHVSQFLPEPSEIGSPPVEDSETGQATRPFQLYERLSASRESNASSEKTEGEQMPSTENRRLHNIKPNQPMSVQYSRPRADTVGGNEVHETTRPHASEIVDIQGHVESLDNFGSMSGELLRTGIDPTTLQIPDQDNIVLGLQTPSGFSPVSPSERRVVPKRPASPQTTKKSNSADGLVGSSIEEGKRDSNDPKTNVPRLPIRLNDSQSEVPTPTWTDDRTGQILDDGKQGRLRTNTPSTALPPASKGNTGGEPGVPASDVKPISLEANSSAQLISSQDYTTNQPSPKSSKMPRDRAARQTQDDNSSKFVQYGKKQSRISEAPTAYPRHSRESLFASGETDTGARAKYPQIERRAFSPGVYRSDERSTSEGEINLDSAQLNDPRANSNLAPSTGETRVQFTDRASPQIIPELGQTTNVRELNEQTASFPAVTPGNRNHMANVESQNLEGKEGVLNVTSQKNDLSRMDDRSEMKESQSPLLQKSSGDMDPNESRKEGVLNVTSQKNDLSRMDDRSEMKESQSPLLQKSSGDMDPNESLINFIQQSTSNKPSNGLNASAPPETGNSQTPRETGGLSNVPDSSPNRQPNQQKPSNILCRPNCLDELATEEQLLDPTKGSYVGRNKVSTSFDNGGLKTDLPARDEAEKSVISPGGDHSASADRKKRTPTEAQSLKPVQPVFENTNMKAPTTDISGFERNDSFSHGEAEGLSPKDVHGVSPDSSTNLEYLATEEQPQTPIETASGSVHALPLATRSGGLDKDTYLTPDKKEASGGRSMQRNPSYSGETLRDRATPNQSLEYAKVIPSDSMSAAAGQSANGSGLNNRSSSAGTGGSSLQGPNWGSVSPSTGLEPQPRNSSPMDNITVVEGLANSMEQNRQLQDVTQAIYSALLEDELLGVLKTTLDNKLLLAFSRLSADRKDAVCSQVGDCARAELTDFVEMFLTAFDNNDDI